MSSPELDLSETSRILLKKAEEDATAVREFAGNPEIGDCMHHVLEYQMADVSGDLFAVGLARFGALS